MHLDLLQGDILQQGRYGNIGVELCFRLVGNPQQVQQNILEVQNRDYHLRLNILDENAVYLLHNHGHYHIGQFALLNYTFQPYVRAHGRRRQGRPGAGVQGLVGDLSLQLAVVLLEELCVRVSCGGG